MNVLVLGSGGREHAICHALARSKRLGRLFVLPGNAGTASLATNIPGDPSDAKLVLNVVRRENIDLTVVGPEDPLAAGIVDALQADGRRAFGPVAAAARLEADKSFAKQLMRQQAIPTAESRVFTDYELACEYISTRDDAMVVKAAGLAKGKGVIVCADPPQGLLAAEKMLVKRAFGEAGTKIVVEERLEGREVSVLALIDRRTIYLLELAQDYKRLRDGDQGPNTGGMGGYSPSDALTDALLTRVQNEILVPVLDGLLRDGIEYRGVLYAGLMLTAAGPKVLEFNCRFGDPETQVLLPRLRTDLLDVIDAVIDGHLDQITLQWDARPAVCVVLASSGYPESSRSGAVIRGLPDTAGRDDLAIFHAGTKLDGGKVVTAGGRVLGVTALGETRQAAREKAYAAADQIIFEGAQMRRDIGA